MKNPERIAVGVIGMRSAPAEEQAALEKAPDAFRTISEVADELDVPQHVLRFWETRFTQIKPLKRGGGRRYYRPEDVDLLRGIRHLLYGEGYTIRGVQRLLRENGVKFVQAVWQAGSEQPAPIEADDEPDTASEQEAADDAASERGRRLLGMLPSLLSEAEAPATQAEQRREAAPTAEAPEAAAPAGTPSAAEPAVPPESVPLAAQPVPTPARAGLPGEETRKLQAALHELSECRRLIEAALHED